MTVIFFLQTAALFLYNHVHDDELTLVPKMFSFSWFGSLAIVYWLTMRMLITELKGIDPVRELEDFSAERRKLTG